MTTRFERGLLAMGACLALLLPASAPAQVAPVPAVPAAAHQSHDPLLHAFRFRSIGPASMGGRIDDIAVVERDPSVMYVGFATGGAWKTVNNGTTWTPIFDSYAVCSIGAVAVDQRNPQVIWVGTGEPNNRQSSSFGDGVYKSVDGGKSFTHVGLRETQSIGRIAIDPTDSDVVYVAAVGHLFGPNPERGVYRTSDGGKHWTLALAIDADTGAVDVAVDPSNPRTVYAASYQRRRVPWGFNGGGPGSGLWKTTDGGRRWARIEGNGFPPGLLGRIGIAVSRSNPRVVYAQVEVGPSAGTGGNVTPDGKPVQPGAARPVPPPQGPPDPARSGVWRSDDRGRTWRIVSNNNDRPMYYSKIRVDPANPEVVYTMGAPFHKSVDGGKTFRVVTGIAHSDHHALWIDPANPRHLVLGNDGGLDVSYDQGETWEFVNTVPAGQFYAVSADMRKPYFVYGGLQDNGTWGGPSATRSPAGITNADWFRVGGGDGFYTQVDPTDPDVVYYESQDGNVQRLDVGTGRSVSIRPRGAGAAAPFTRGPAPPPNLQPPLPEGEAIRFFWNTPLLLSPHNPRLLYVGGNRLFKSYDRGDTYVASPDLSRNISRFERPIMGVPGDAPMASKHDGAGAYSSVVTVSESPVVPGVVWAGTNDGNVQVSRDGGATWTSVGGRIAGPPDEAHVSRVEAGHFDGGTCYVSIDAHRTDDLRPYLFVTRDYGASWTSIASNLPVPGHVNVVREDPRNPRLLYVGTEYGLFVSLDGGGSWKRFMNGLPTVRVDDLLVHPRDNDLIVATHGRSLYILDDVSPLQQVDPAVLDRDVHLFTVRSGTNWRTDVRLNRSVGGAKHFRGENPAPGTAISYYLKAPAAGTVTIAVSDVTGRVVRTLTGSGEAGLNRVQWNLRGEAGGGPASGTTAGARLAGPVLPAGTYLVTLTTGGRTLKTTLLIEEDEAP